MGFGDHLDRIRTAAPGAFLLLLGLGAGLGMAPLLTMALRDVPPQDAGLGSGIVNVSLQLSAALGLAVLGTIATDRTGRCRRRGSSCRSG